MTESETIYEEINRLGQEINVALREINRIRKESGCPDGASLMMHLHGVPLFPTPEEG